MGVVTAVAAVASAGMSIDQSNKQRKAMSEARREARIKAAIEKRKADIQNARARRKAAAESAVQRARIQARAAARGSESSGTDVSLGAVTKQTQDNISFQRQLQSLTNQQIASGVRAGRFESQAQAAGARAQIPGQLGLGFGSIIGNFDGMSNALSNAGSWVSNATTFGRSG